MHKRLLLFALCAVSITAGEVTVHFPPPKPPLKVTSEYKDWPRSVDAAVNKLLADLPDDEKQKLRSIPESDLIRLHHTLGLAIRNKFGLWAGNHELLEDSGKEHPDDASMEIIVRVWKRLNEH